MMLIFHKTAPRRFFAFSLLCAGVVAQIGSSSQVVALQGAEMGVRQNANEEKRR
jgi:hypothetical protein